MEKCSCFRCCECSEVLAHFEGRQLKPYAFAHNGVRYAIRDIAKVKEEDNPVFSASGLKDLKYWVVTQDGIKAELQWHRDTGDWTINKLLPAKNNLDPYE